MRKTKPSRKTGPLSSLGDVLKVIRAHRSFLITTHVNPDGDGLGAESALFLALRGLGKKVTVVNHDPLPSRFEYLAFSPHYKTSDRIPPHEVCFVLDAGDFTRIREGVRRAEFGLLVNIDHHFSNNRYGDLNLIRPKAAATGEVVYDLIKALPVKISKEIAEAVYTSLVTDTGRFRYSNTTAEVLRLAAELVDKGADPEKISDRIFAGISRQATELVRLALGTVRIHGEGRIGSMTLSQKDFLSSGAVDEDTDNLINFVRNLDTVKVAFFLKERPDGLLKLSLRSRKGVNSADIAQLFGGGGHVYAAGAVLPGPLSKAHSRVLAACKSALK